MPLKPIYVEPPFQQRGLYFIGEIHPPSIGQHKWILSATHYFTKWIEAILIQNANDKVVRIFLLENIFSRFGCPRKPVTDNAQAFKSVEMAKFYNNFNVIIGHSTPYYLQGNGLDESSNKSLVKIIKKMLAENKRSWDSKLVYALWEDWISTKK